MKVTPTIAATLGGIAVASGADGVAQRSDLLDRGFKSPELHRAQHFHRLRPRDRRCAGFGRADLAAPDQRCKRNRVVLAERVVAEGVDGFHRKVAISSTGARSLRSEFTAAAGSA